MLMHVDDRLAGRGRGLQLAAHGRTCRQPASGTKKFTTRPGQ
jgi:hypothetical protein